MAAKQDRTRKMIVRTALVTSTTIATLVGAQNLAMLDVAHSSQALAQSPDPVAMVVTPSASSVGIQQTAPSIVILRSAGQGQSQPQSVAATSNIQPPNPVQLAAPQPQVIQQPAAVPQPIPQVVPQRSRSSR